MTRRTGGRLARSAGRLAHSVGLVCAAAAVGSSASGGAPTSAPAPPRLVAVHHEAIAPGGGTNGAQDLPGDVAAIDLRLPPPRLGGYETASVVSTPSCLTVAGALERSSDGTLTLPLTALLEGGGATGPACSGTVEVRFAAGEHAEVVAASVVVHRAAHAPGPVAALSWSNSLDRVARGSHGPDEAHPPAHYLELNLTNLGAGTVTVIGLAEPASLREMRFEPYLLDQAFPGSLDQLGALEPALPATLEPGDTFRIALVFDPAATLPQDAGAMTVRPAVIVEAAGARWAVTFDKAEVSWGAGLSALGTVVATYVDAYRLPALEREALHAAHASLTRADIALGPRLTVRERARSVPAGVALDVEVGLEAPLFDAAALVTRDLAMADLKLRQAEAAGALSLQLAAYLKDRTAAPLLRRALAAASDALPDPLSLPSAPEALRPEDRDRLEAFASLADTWRWLLSTSASLEERIGHGPPVPQHPTPSPHEVIAALTPSLARVIGEGVAPPHEGVTASTAYASVAGPPAPRPGAGVMWEEALDACLVGSASLRVAAARRSSLRRAEALDVAPDLTFTAGLQLSHELTLGVPAHGTSHMSVRVEGRYRLPRSWPVAGTLAATFGTGGLSQELEVSWPSAVFSPPPTDPEEQYDSEVAAARSEARSLLDAVHGAISDLASVRRALAWQVLDADPRLSPPGARALVGEPFGSAWNSVTAPLRNALLDPRLRVAMGELRAAAAVIDLAAFCGVLTPAAGALPAR